MTDVVKDQNSTSILQSTCYALPVIPSAMLLTPMAIIQGIYAKYYEISLAYLASIILISRVIDAISDPVIGFSSDRCRQKYGTRKPFIAFGGLALIVCGYYLYAPVGEVTAAYFGFWSIAFYIAYTFFEIPHLTWPSDIAHHSRDKTKLYSYRVVASYAGMILFYCIPLFPVFASSEITPTTLRVTFVVSAVMVLPFLFVALRYVPKGDPPLQGISLRPSSVVQRFSDGAREFKVNKPFLVFMLAFLFGSFAVGMWYGLIYIYVDAYLKLGGEFARMFLSAFLIGIVVAPLWYWLAIRIGKKKTWVISIVLMIASFICTGMLDPGESTFIHLLIIKVVQTSAFVCSGIMAPSMLSEIVDYSHWRFKTEKSASYFSVKVFFEKTSNALGVALGLAIAGWFEFDVSANEHGIDSILGLKLAIAWIPASLAVIALMFVLLCPIDERRHRIIRKRLDAHLDRNLNLPRGRTRNTAELVPGGSVN